jgi:HNH endonuclease
MRSQNFIEPVKADLIDALEGQFLDGYVNVWGVPEGAGPVIRNLAAGDTVLLIQSTQMGGRVPALCPVRVFPQQQLRQVSRLLWNDEKYAYVFFFRTELLSLTWDEFRAQVSYQPNFDPRGHFYRLKEERLASYGGSTGYLNFLRKDFANLAPSPDAPTFSQVEAETELGSELSPSMAGVREALEAVRAMTLSPVPQLTSGMAPAVALVNAIPRRKAFGAWVKKLYDYRCAICGLGLRAPSGEPEVQAAHIYPKRLDGQDDLRNGICLCRLHHWAFDSGWIAVSDDHRVLVRDEMPAGPDYDPIGRWRGRRVHLPSDHAKAPHPVFLREHRKLTGFS